jgi:hypothetical protein
MKKKTLIKGMRVACIMDRNWGLSTLWSWGSKFTVAQGSESSILFTGHEGPFQWRNRGLG